MTIRNLTLGLGIVLSSPALAFIHEPAHSGSSISHKKHFSKPSAHHSSYVYEVRNGDFDWAIAHKHGIKLSQLHAMNPHVNWGNLQVGTRLAVPSSLTEAPVIVSEKKASHHSYTVADGEFDWIIAHRNGMTLSELKRLNPTVNLQHLRPGQTLVLSGGGSRKQLQKSTISRYAVITGDSVKIHRSEGLKTETITTVDLGTRAKVLDRDGNWYRLRFPKGTEGWVLGEFLKSMSYVAEAMHSSNRHRSSHLAYSHHRRHHSSSSEAFVAVNPKALKGDRLLSKAASYQGVRYVWGGMSRSGTDCSGFTSQVYRSQGIKLPRTSGEQSHIGQHVKRGELQPGDLVFFHTGRGSRINHVGIYMGSNKFIHASSGGHKVRVSSLSGFYANRFATARRVRKHTSKAAR